MSAITIESGNIKIPGELVQSDGLVILTIVPNAYLILRADALINYPAEKLVQVQQIIRDLASPPETTYNYHPTKARALRQLRAEGIPVSGGEEYGLNPSSVSLEKVQQGLASIKGSLADEIIAQREER